MVYADEADGRPRHRLAKRFVWRECSACGRMAPFPEAERDRDRAGRCRLCIVARRAGSVPPPPERGFG